MQTFKFFKKDTKKWIDAPLETWQWEAYYEDGTALKQFAEDGVFHQFIEIDQSKLAVFKMVSSKYPQVYTLLFSDPTMKLIHFYRNTVLNAGAPGEEHLKTYCFGYEKAIGGKVQKVILMITPNNGLIVTEEPSLAVI